MCNTRDPSTLNFKTSLPQHAPSQGKITDKFMASKMLSAGARDDVRNNLIETIETNCRVRWHVIPNLLRRSKTNRLDKSHPQIHQMERVPTVATTELRRISRTIHITRNWIGWNSRMRTKTYKMITLENAVYTFAQTARLVTNLIAHVDGHATLIQIRNRRNLNASRTEDCFTFFYGIFDSNFSQQPQPQK